MSGGGAFTVVIRARAGRSVRYQLSLDGLHCENCARALTEALSACHVVADVRVADDLRHAEVELRAGNAGEGGDAIALAVGAVQAAGYRVTGFRRLSGAGGAT